MKPIKLEPGQIWKKGTLDMRTIDSVSQPYVYYYAWGGVKRMAWYKNFVAWLWRNNITKPIGICDLKTGKARAV